MGIDTDKDVNRMNSAVLQRRLYPKVFLFTSLMAFLRPQAVHSEEEYDLPPIRYSATGHRDAVERAVEEVTATEVYEEQSRIRHNIRSLVNVIKRKISPEAQPYIHLFATSADILDTATTLRF